jgi:YidC/Oxa1 family membrane protein insertase
MKPQDNNQKNFIVAMLLMLGVLMAWQYFYAKPALEKPSSRLKSNNNSKGQAPAAQPSQGTSGQTTSQLPAPGGTSQVPGATAVPGASVALPRDAALEQSPRVAIDTPTVSGSINLKGARLDDLRLKDYHETVDQTSPTIVLLSPANTENTYFAEQGWLSPAGAAYKLPNADTVWTAPAGATLSPGNPVALNWDNGEGLTFTRTFSIDENYMISVQQSVANATGSPVLLFPYARINRQGTPKVAGIYVLFEGLHGVLNDSLEEITYADLADNDPGSFTQTSTGGWLGITDKYWGTALIPDQKMEVTGGLKFVGQPGKDAYQADFAATQPVTIAPARICRGQLKTVCRCQEVDPDRRVPGHARHQQVRADGGLGLVLLHHQAAVRRAALDPRSDRQLRCRHSGGHGAAEASVLPAAEQVLRFDEQDEEACAGDGEDQAALPR